jgi:hypothetical protein
MPKMRGASVLATLDFLRATFGEPGLARVLTSLSPGAREQLAGPAAILPDGWYDTSALSELTRSADSLLGKGDLSLARVMGKHVAFADVNRFFRWLFRLAGPKALFSRAGSVWNSYYDTGTYVLESVEEGRAILRIEGWDAADEVLCRRLEGWIARAVELTIGPDTNPVIHETHHRAHDASFCGAMFCRFEVSWGEPEKASAA